MIQKIVVSNLSGAAAGGVRLAFHVGRSKMREVQIERLPTTAQVESRVGRDTVEVRWSEPVEAGLVIVARIDVIGEPVSLLQLEWLPVEGEEVGVVAGKGAPPHVAAAIAAAASSEKGTLVVASVTSAAARATSRAAAEAMRRRASLEKIEQAGHRELHEFFLEYDRATNDQLLRGNADLEPEEQAFRGRVLLEMADLLARRVLLRARVMRTHRLPTEAELEEVDRERMAEGDATTPAVPIGPAEIDRVSALQLALFEKRFPALRDGDRTRFADAFMRFANGELRTGLGTDPNAEPNSAFAFCFAEFAFLAIERNIHADRWEFLLPPLVAMQPVFAKVYRDPGPCRPFVFDDYRGAFFHVGIRAFHTDERKKKILAQHTGLSVEALAKLAGAHALDAFAGGRSRVC